MAGRIGFRQRAALRAGARVEVYDAPPPAIHLGGLWLAAGAPLLATLVLLALRFVG